MDWIEVAIKTTTQGADIAAHFFYEVGVQGVVIEDPDDIRLAELEARTWDYIDESVLRDMDEAVLVKGYLYEDVAVFDKLQLIRDRTKWALTQDFGLNLGTLEMILTNVREEDWANNWKKYYKPIKVSERIVIKPTWETYEPTMGECVLELDPGMAFGTGTHETTVLCIQAIDKAVHPSASLLDVGCGTGVLAIAGLLMGAKRADCVDIDSNAVRVARENAVLNHVQDKMTVYEGNLLDKIQGTYTIVVANIIADVVIQLSDFIGNYLEPAGVFIASGIILDRLEEVMTAVTKAGLTITHKQTMGEWAVVVSRKDA